jgi:hypothetical protein
MMICYRKGGERTIYAGAEPNLAYKKSYAREAFQDWRYKSELFADRPITVCGVGGGVNQGCSLCVLYLANVQIRPRFIILLEKFDSLRNTVASTKKNHLPRKIVRYHLSKRRGWRILTNLKRIMGNDGGDEDEGDNKEGYENDEGEDDGVEEDDGGP